MEVIVAGAAHKPSDVVACESRTVGWYDSIARKTWVYLVQKDGGSDSQIMILPENCGQSQKTEQSRRSHGQQLVRDIGKGEPLQSCKQGRVFSVHEAEVRDYLVIVTLTLIQRLEPEVTLVRALIVGGGRVVGVPSCVRAVRLGYFNKLIAWTNGASAPGNAIQPRQNVFECGVFEGTEPRRVVRPMRAMMGCGERHKPRNAFPAGLAGIYAEEVRNTPVRVNILDPGAVRTAMRAEAMPGEDPATLPPPEAITDSFVALALPSCTRHGDVVQASVSA